MNFTNIFPTGCPTDRGEWGQPNADSCRKCADIRYGWPLMHLCHKKPSTEVYSEPSQTVLHVRLGSEYSMPLFQISAALDLDVDL